MGVKRTYVGTSVNRAIPDNRVPNGVQQGILRSILTNDDEVDMVENIQNEILGGIGMRAERMYESCARGDYLFGLPSGQFDTGNEGLAQIQATLDAIEGTPVVIDYSYHCAPNDAHIGWVQLMTSYGYNATTNELAVLSTAKGFPVYLDDMLVVIPEAEKDHQELVTLAQWAPAARSGWTPERFTMTAQTSKIVKPSPIQVDPVATAEYLLLKYIWKDAAGHLQRESVTLSLAGYDVNADYFHVRYFVGTTAKYWIYKDGAGTYPDLDAVYQTRHTDSGSFFPFLYFVYGHTFEYHDKTTDSYIAGKTLADRLSLPFDSISESIEQNPDSSQIEQAIMMMAVPAITTNELERRYLFSFFDNLYNSPQYASNRFNSSDQAVFMLGSAVSALIAPKIVIQDTRFKLSVNFNAIYKRLVAGAIGVVGTHDSGYVTSGTTMDVIDIVTGETTTIQNPANYHYYRRQVTPSTYEEVQVTFLQTRYWILGDFKQAVGEGDDPILIIPLDRSITEDYSIPEREQLYARSMQYVINAAVVQHLRWYQTEAFQVALIVIAVIILIASWGSDAAEAAALIAAGEYLAAALLILSIVIEAYVVNLAFKAVARWLGPKWALILAIVAAVLGVADGIENGGLAGAPWASAFLEVATGLAKAAADQYTADIQNLLHQQQDLLAEENKDLKLLETAQELLDGSVRLDPFVIFGESPRDYYNRTVHSGNIGVLSVDAISSYVDISLMLPTLSQTLGGNTQ